MRDRGLTYKDHLPAIQALKRIGYYRLSAYTFPFRIMDDSKSPPELRDEFERDATLEDALQIYLFDEKLRTILLEGLNAIEVGLAVQVGYTLGKRDPLGHEGTEHLNEFLCNEVLKPDADGHALTRYEAWKKRYDKLRSDAKDEEYVRHHDLQYDGHLPVWVATEFMDFGCLLRLFDLMRSDDQKRIAVAFGVKREGYAFLYRWLKALNILRNHCAHSNRVWNRTTVNAPSKFPNALVDDRLHHLNSIENPKRLRVYVLAALIAYLVTKVNPASNWPRSFATQAKKLKSVRGRTVITEMGFPEGWESLDIWNWDPSAK